VEVNKIPGELIDITELAPVPPSEVGDLVTIIKGDDIGEAFKVRVIKEGICELAKPGRQRGNPVCKVLPCSSLCVIDRVYRSAGEPGHI
jgi:hypothetical protein